MNFLHWILRRRQEENELDEELRFHLAEEARLRIDRGLNPDDATRQARRDFGNVTLAKEVTRDMWGWTILERAAQDLRFAARLLSKSRAFTVLAIVALALGIGATTAIFTVVNAVLVRPLPFPDPARLAMIWEVNPAKRHNVIQTYNFLEWRSRNRSFENVAAVLQIPVNIDRNGDAVQIPALRVTAGFFEILGVRPMLGRTIASSDDLPNSPPVVVLGYEAWRNLFGGRRDIVGQKVSFARSPHEVIGVMPPGFVFPPAPRAPIFTAIRFDPAQAKNDGRNYRTIARLKRGVSVEQADAEMKAIAAQLSREWPKMDAKWSAAVVPLMQETVKESRTALLVLLGAVVFVLLIACANVSNLLLMRASGRRREMAMRIALGAGRTRLVQQLLIESVLLASAGGIGGFLLAYWGVPAILRMLPPAFLPRMQEISVDRGILLFSMAVSLACGLFFGIIPALQASRSHISEGLRHGGRYGSASGRPLRNSLVISEVALAMLLTIGAGLMVRSFLLLHSTDAGFRPERLLTVRMILYPQAQTLEQVLERRAALTEAMLQRIRTLPQVTAASSIHLLPMTGLNSGTDYSRADRPAPPPGEGTGGGVSIISPDYFRTMGIRVIAGREFNDRDTPQAQHVAILNQTAVNMFYPGENPIGKSMRIWWGPDGKPVQIVGVVSDIHHEGLDTKPEQCVYMPQVQQPSAFLSLVIRTNGDPHAAIPAVKEQIRVVAPVQGAADIQSMEEVMADSMARPRLDAVILAVFGIVALALACVGIYAVISYSVEQRTREMGIRLALGAAPGGILGMVLREGLLLAASGIALGVLAAFGLTRYLASLLFSVRPTDPAVFAAVSAILAIAAAAGCYFPARRATHVDPSVVLREE